MDRWSSTPPVPPPVSRKRMFQANQHHDSATGALGPSAEAGPDVATDAGAAAEHLLQHWYLVRHALTRAPPGGAGDGDARGRLPARAVVGRLADAFPLVGMAALRELVDAAEARAGGAGAGVSYDDLMAVVRQEAGPGDAVGGQREHSRFAAKGIMDKRMQKVLQQQQVPLGTRRPPHALGHSAINCPYGIEGDAERMEAIFHTYMDARVDSIQQFFVAMDTNRDGRLSYSEFESAMLRMDPETPKAAIQALIRALDEGHKGYITLDDVRENFSVEFMKNKAHRNSPGYRNILAWPQAEAGAGAGGFTPAPPKGAAPGAQGGRPARARLAPVNTKAQVLRLEAIRETLREHDPLRAEKMRQQGNLKQTKPLRSELKRDGLVGFATR